MRHPFEGIIEHSEHDIPPAEPSSPKTSRVVSASRRSFFGITAAAVAGSFGLLLARPSYGQDSDGRGNTQGGTIRLETQGGRSRSEREGRNRGDRDRRGDRGERNRGDDYDRNRGRRRGRDDDDRDQRRRRRRRRRNRRDRERDQWWDRLDSYYFGRNYWGNDYDRRRWYDDRYRWDRRNRWNRGRGWNNGRGRYTTQALGEEGGRRGRGRRDRDRGRGRYTTYALGEEG